MEITEAFAKACLFQPAEMPTKVVVGLRLADEADVLKKGAYHGPNIVDRE